MKKLLSAALAAALLLSPLAISSVRADQDDQAVLDEVPTEPEIKNKPAAKKLIAKHALALQWVETKKKGVIDIWQDANHVRIKGEQRDPKTGNFVTVEGWVTKIEAKQFTMRGRIVTKVHHIAGGQECAREGDFTFLIKGARKFWRLQEMQNPCDTATDYVDITIAPLK